MRKRRVCLAVLLLGVGLLAGLFWLQPFPSNEPSYDGQKLSEWVDLIWNPKARSGQRELAQSIRRFDETPVALRNMGTKALPLLLQWSDYQPGIWYGKVAPRLNMFLMRLNPHWQIAEENARRKSRAHAARYALFMLLEDPNRQTRSQVTNAIQHLHPRLAALAVPSLTDCLQSKNADASAAASNTLLQIEPRALVEPPLPAEQSKLRAIP